MRPQVLIPWRGGCTHRERALRSVLDRYDTAGLAVTVAQAPPGPWIKARALMPAIEAADAEIVIAADADVWCDELEPAVEAVEGGAAWAIPHRDVHRLTPDGHTLDQPPYVGMEGGGYVIAPREVLLTVPLDPRFIGWGGEDIAWAMALHFLVGPAWRGRAPLWHYWHPPQDRRDRKRGSPANEQLRRRYAAARYHPPTLRALVSEANDALHPPQPPLHDSPPLSVDRG